VHKSKYIMRWILLIVTGVVFALLLTIFASFVLAYRARAEAARYLHVVVPLRIGTTFDATVAQLRDAGVPTTIHGDCHHECILESRFVNRWQYVLHLAPPTGLVGRIDFGNDKLVYKSTILGRDFCCSAAVTESTSTISGTSANVDSSGRPRKIFVDLSALDFTEYRKQAYAFNLSCIGSMRGCEPEELLPTLNDLERALSK